MLSVALISLLVPATGAVDAAVTPVLTQQSNLPVRVWLNQRDARLGDRVRAYASTQSDGYLLVLHAEPDGRIRVLFPVDPVEDNFVRGGDEIEIRGRGNREAFRVYASSGVGTVYAAFSRDPFVFEQFVRADHWDYSLRDTWYVRDDAEAEITNIVVAMASGAYFDYDVAQYGVGETVAQASGQQLTWYGGTYIGVGPYYYYPGTYYWRRWAILTYPHYYPYPYYSWGWHPYYWSYPYHWGYPYSWGFGFGFGFSFGYSWYPYYYSGYYGPCCYYGGYYPAPYYATHYRGYGYAQPRLRYTSQLAPANGQSRTRRVYAASQQASSARRLGSSGSLTPATRGPASSARRLSPTSATAGAADRLSPVTRNTATTSRRSFPQQPVRTTPARRVVTDAPDRVTTGARPTSGEVGGATPRRVTPTRTPNTATTPRVSPARPTSTGSAQARPVRPTSSRSAATSTRRTPQMATPRMTTPRPTVRPSAPTSATARPSTVQRRTVTPSPSSRVRQPTRPSLSLPSRAPTRITAPTLVRPSPATGFRTAVRTTTQTAVRTTRRRP